jgi:predicted metal-dependent enzyme (double-stranded beta helix superfamily)
MAAGTDVQTAEQRFIAQMRDLFAREADPATRWKAVPALLSELLADAEVRAASQRWPVPSQILAQAGERRGGNLLFYEDPDYGFVINGQVHEARSDVGEPTMAHDHGQNWTAYGLLEGRERIVTFERTDDGSRPDHAEVRTTADYVADPGDIHLAKPRDVHVELSIGERTAAIIVRSMRDGGPNNLHGRYNVETGAYSESPGPRQIPTEMLPTSKG